jgi:hypothetical protein
VQGSLCFRAESPGERLICASALLAGPKDLLCQGTDSLTRNVYAPLNGAANSVDARVFPKPP